MTANIAITNRSLHDQVVSRVRDLIIEGVLEPGSRIDEARLIEELEVSRTPFREATMKLHNGPDATWDQATYDKLQAIE